jgi:hypothetical protein
MQVDSSELECLLRVLTGEVGEQRTALDHAFRTFGERPDAVLDAVAQEAVTWTRTSSESQISPLQLSEWIHDVISKSIQPPVDRLRSVGQRAIESLQKIAKEMGRSDAPSGEDFELLFRDLPRFELATLPDAISVRRWKFWGESALRSRIRANLRESIGAHLTQELHHYGVALSGWSEQIVGKLEALVNSYADAYRVQLHRLSGLSGKDVNLGELEADLELLLRWNVDNTPDVRAQQA